VTPGLPTSTAGRVAVGDGAMVLLGVAAGGALLLFPGLGQFGLWSPGETDVANRAISRPWSAPLPALGLRLFGMNEAAARAPGAVVGLLTLLAVAWVGTCLFRRRTGLLAALTLAAFPLFVLQARQLTSDLLACLGSTLALGGLAEFGRAARGSSMQARVPAGAGAAAVLTAFGLALATIGGGVLAGTLPVLGAVVAHAWPDQSDDGATGRGRRNAVAVLTLVAMAVLGAALVAIRHRAGQFSWWLGGVPRAGTPSSTVEGALEILGFGLFPWGGLALFAFFGSPAPVEKSTSVGNDQPNVQISDTPGAAESTSAGNGQAPASSRQESTSVGDGRGARALEKSTSVGGERGARAVLGLGAWGMALGTVQLHLVGHVSLTLLPAVALALGDWFDRRAARGAAPQPLLGFVAVVSALLLARDLTLVPEALVSSHLATRIAWPAGIELGPWVLGTGGVAAAGVALLLGAPAGWPTWVRSGALCLALGPPITLAFGLAHDLVPRLSRHLSSKAQLDHFRQLAPQGATLALFQVARAEAGVFHPPATIEARTDGDLISHLRAGSGGGFALIPRPQLAALEARFAEAGVDMVVADASSNRHLLLAGHLPVGTPDQNPLRAFVWHPPRTSAAGAATTPAAPAWANPTLPVQATWAEAIELVGAEFPARVSRGHALTLTLVFRVRARPPAGQKICVHLEMPGQPLFNGDHAPVGGDFATDHWRPGDVIRDVYTFDVPRVTTAAGRHRLLVGWWPGGDAPRLAITDGHGDGSDRVLLGAINIE
jgi:hypothetical protein